MTRVKHCQLTFLAAVGNLQYPELNINCQLTFLAVMGKHVVSHISKLNVSKFLGVNKFSKQYQGMMPFQYGTCATP